MKQNKLLNKYTTNIQILRKSYIQDHFKYIIKNMKI